MDQQVNYYQDMDNNNLLEEQRTNAMHILSDYTDNRCAWYRSLSLNKLLDKDLVMFAARGASTAHDYLIEAFHAVESSSEETVMGSKWQRIIASISDAIDSGDLTVVRDNTVWVCELKAQPNTTNSTSYVGELRGLRTRLQEITGRRRTSGQPAKAALCITRDKRAIDETRTYQAPAIDVGNQDLNGFEYRYLSGSAMWQWLVGIDDPINLFTPLSQIANDSVLATERESAINRLWEELSKQLYEHGLKSSIDDVVMLRQLLRDEKGRKKKHR